MKILEKDTTFKAIAWKPSFLWKINFPLKLQPTNYLTKLNIPVAYRFPQSNLRQIGQGVHEL